MKKLLSILGSLSMVATAGMAVVACSSEDNANNPSHSYNELKGWIDDSKDNHNTDIVFIGGRKDVDTISFLAAKKTVADGNTKDIDPNNAEALTNNADDIDKKFNSSATNSMNTNWNSFVINAQGSTSDSTDNNLSELMKAFWGIKDGKTEGTYSQKMMMHTILVDDVNSFFTNGVGKKFRNSYLKDQVKQWVNYYYDKNKENAFGKPNGDKQWNNAILNILNPMTASLKKDSGPYFLIFNNGNLSGISRGYKNYAQFHSEYSSNTENNLTTYQAEKDMTSLFQGFKDNIWGSLNSWIQGSFYPDADWRKEKTIPDNFTISNKASGPKWDNSLTGNTYNKKNKADMIPDNIPTTFAIDPKNYID